MRFHICAKKKSIEGATQEEFYRIGILKISPQGRTGFIKLFHQPDNKYFVFDSDWVELPTNSIE